MGEHRLELLGTCRLTAPDGDPVVVKGRRKQTAVAIAALEEGVRTDAAMSALLSRGRWKSETDAQAVKVLRSRLPAEVKKQFGAGPEDRWEFSGVSVDVIEWKGRARALIEAGYNADKEGLRKALKALGRALLPEVPAESADEPTWLVRKREDLQALRLELVEAAMAWADQRSDPWAAQLEELARDLRGEEGESRSHRRADQEPTVSNIWSPDSVELIGRQGDLKVLGERFGGGARRQAIWGAAGIGKSALALAYATERERYYRVRWRVDAENDIKLREGLRHLGRRLGIPSAEDALDEDPTAERFYADLADHLSASLAGRWLLVFDNVDHPANLEPIWTQLPDNGHVLVTSQWQRWEEIGARELHLWNLELDDAKLLLAQVSHRLLDDESGDLAGICQLLQCHPLLLKHAGMTMYADGIGPTEYLGHLENEIERAVRLWPELGVTRLHAVTTYRLAIEKATAEVPSAKPLIQVLSFLASEHVNESILSAGIVGCAPELGASDAVIRARRELCARSLIEDLQRTQMFCVPSVTQAVVRINLSDEEHRVWLGAAVRALKRSLPAAGAIDAYEQRLWLAPHIEAVIGHVEQLGDVGLRMEVAELASQLGLLRRSQAEWEAAEAAHKQAIDFSRDDGDRKATAMRAVRLANVIRNRMRFREADTVMSTVLPALRDAVDPDDVDLAYALTVQARILRRKPGSSPGEAYRYLEEALEILDRHGEAEVDQLSRTLNYCAVLLRQLGRYEEAEANSRRGFQLLAGCDPEEWLGMSAKEPAGGRPLAVHLRSLGNLWRLLGRFDESLQAHGRALQILTGLYRDDHTDVGLCLDSIGRAHRERGDFDQAISCFKRAKEIGERRFGPEAAPAATGVANIALTLVEQEKFDEAVGWAQEAVELCERMDGRGDQGHGPIDGVSEVGGLRSELTGWAMFVRARAWSGIGRARDAWEGHREVLALRKRLYGSGDHPHVAGSLEGLGDAKAADGQIDAAVALHQQARAMRLVVFGPKSSYWVGISDARLGELLKAPEERLKHLEAADDALGERLVGGHPRIVRLRAQLQELQGAAFVPSS